MRAVVVRALTIATRRAAFTACLLVHVGLLSSFLLLWPDGVPVMHGSVYEQTRWFEAAVLLCVLPWASVRLAVAADMNTQARLSLLSGAGPSTLALGSLVAIAAVLGLITATALPVLLRAQLMSAAPLSRVAGDEVTCLAFACAVGAFGEAARVCRGRVARWLITIVASMTLAIATHSIVSSSLMATTVFASVALIVALLLMQRARASQRYLVERQP
jgi:hypothetical protein